MQSLECVELFLYVLLPKMSVTEIKNHGLAFEILINCHFNDESSFLYSELFQVDYRRVKTHKNTHSIC